MTSEGSGGIAPDGQSLGGQPDEPGISSFQGSEQADRQQASADPQPQSALNPFEGTALPVIVVAILALFQPTISSSSWTPWIRAALAIAVLTVAIVAIVLAVKMI